MISLRKLAFSFLAPIGALTIIGTGFATWTFSMGEVEVSENVQDNVNVTAEVTNGNLEVLNVPKVLVFSQGDQGQDDLFDGISFYSDKVVKKGQDFAVKITNPEGVNHKLSFVYDNTIAEPKIYFSWSETSDYSSIISGELTSSNAGDSYFGSWGDSGYGNDSNDTYTVELTLNQANEAGVFTGSINIKDNNSKDICNDTFTYETKNNITLVLNDNGTGSYGGASFTYVVDEEKIVAKEESGSFTLTIIYDEASQSLEVTYNDGEYQFEGTLTDFVPAKSEDTPEAPKYVGTWEGEVGPNPTITVTDSTFAFRYTYDNPDLINEDDTHFKLNVELGLFLDSREGFKFKNVRLDGDTLVWEKPEGTQGSLKLFNSLTLQKNDGKDDYDLAIGLDQKEGSLSSRITFPNLILSKLEAGDTSLLPAGTYSGVSLSGIPCTLNLTKNDDATYNISLEIGAMTHYLSLSDDFKAVQNKEGDKKGFFNITSSNESKVYAEGTLHMDIDDSNLKDGHYIDFTCQLANYLRYASVNVKPNELEKYFGLRVASILGGWEFKIIINAYFTAI